MPDLYDGCLSGSVALSVGKIEAGLSSEVTDPPAPVAGAPKSAFAGFRFSPEVIVVAVRWYLRFNLSYRDVADLLVERGVQIDHVAVYRWVQRFTPLFADAARYCRHSPGDRWHVAETYVKVNGVWRYVCRAVDQHGQGGRCVERWHDRGRLSGEVVDPLSFVVAAEVGVRGMPVSTGGDRGRSALVSAVRSLRSSLTGDRSGREG
jgi:DDE domain